MNAILRALLLFITDTCRSRASMQIEILALRHQLAIYHRSVRRPRVKPADWILWFWILRLWPGWKDALVIVQPRTVIVWQRRRKPPSPTWMTFLCNHMSEMISIDFFVVPTVKFEILFVFLILSHDRRRVLHFNVTHNPSAQWTAQQIVEAFPWGNVPRYLLRDRDSIYGAHFRRRVKGMGIEEVLIAPRSPWQNPYCERLVGSIRRECTDHIIVLNERHLRRTLSSFFRYYHGFRTHLSLEMDTPSHLPVQTQDCGDVAEISELGGLHHHYERRAA